MCICFTSRHLKPALKGSYCTTAIKDIPLAVSESRLDAQTYNVRRTGRTGHTRHILYKVTFALLAASIIVSKQIKK